MRVKRGILLITAGVFAAGFARAESTFTADPTHGEAGFAISHLVISKVKGHFGKHDATLVLDDDGKLVSAEATMDVESIDTANTKRDDHLRSADFFDAKQFPAITFKSKSVTDSEIVGDFTIRDVTKEISLPYELKGPVKDPWGNTKLGFAASIVINRKDYGLTWSKTLETGGLVVGDEVEISVDMEFGQN